MLYVSVVTMQRDVRYHNKIIRTVFSVLWRCNNYEHFSQLFTPENRLILKFFLVFNTGERTRLTIGV